MADSKMPKIVEEEPAEKQRRRRRRGAKSDGGESQAAGGDAPAAGESQAAAGDALAAGDAFAASEALATADSHDAAAGGHAAAGDPGAFAGDMAETQVDMPGELTKEKVAMLADTSGKRADDDRMSVATSGEPVRRRSYSVPVYRGGTNFIGKSDVKEHDSFPLDMQVA